MNKVPRIAVILLFFRFVPSAVQVPPDEPSFSRYTPRKELMQKLSVSGRGFSAAHHRIFLNGINLPWIDHGDDFGDGKYWKSGHRLRKAVTKVQEKQGNVLRLFLHGFGDRMPKYENQGHISACDTKGTMAKEILDFLDFAETQKVFIILVLWGGWNHAKMSPAAFSNVQMIMNDSTKLQAYLKNCLAKLVEAVAGHNALAAWEIISEPEALLDPGKAGEDPCFSTEHLTSEIGVGSTGMRIYMQRMLVFINWHIEEIESADNTTLVTMTTSTDRTLSERFPDSYPKYSWKCLQRSGPFAGSKLKFIQFSTFLSKTSVKYRNPLEEMSSEYNLDIPIVFSAVSGSCSWMDLSLEALSDQAILTDYRGFLTWSYKNPECSDVREEQLRVISAITRKLRLQIPVLIDNPLAVLNGTDPDRGQDPADADDD